MTALSVIIYAGCVIVITRQSIEIIETTPLWTVVTSTKLTDTSADLDGIDSLTDACTPTDANSIKNEQNRKQIKLFIFS